MAFRLKNRGTDKGAPAEAPPETEETEGEQVGLYFKVNRNVEFISTGCTVLNCVLGGGWALGRIANVVGDKSTGKTLCAIEACANFAHQFPDGKIWYRETEAAFDRDYAEFIGLPIDRVDFGEDRAEGFFTIEDIFEDLDAKLASIEKDDRGLYIIDSLDALSDRGEIKRDIDQGSYGAEKAKKLSQLFRRLVQKIENRKVCILIVSQTRDNIGAMFGDKHTRSGGKALDFYSSQILWLHHIGQVKKTVRGVQRVIGVDVKAQCKKNKVGLAFRTCEFPVLFSFGIDDVTASLNWLLSIKKGAASGYGDEAEVKKLLLRVPKLSMDEYMDMQEKLKPIVEREWQDLESEFLPKRRKYE